MGGLVRQQCLACTRHPRPCCDGSGVRLVREPDGQIVDVQLCPRWPASWDEPVAYLEALAEHSIDPIAPTAVSERIWPAVQAEAARTRQLPRETPADVQPPTYSEFGSSRALGLVMIATVAMLVLVLVVVLAVRA